MPPVRATVSWPDGAPEPIVTPDPISVPAAHGATVIQWVCGDNVTALSVSGLDPQVFHPASSNGMVARFSTTDANADTNQYNYNVGATRSSGQKTEHDPKIQNGA
jgi:hypothetical protein